MTDPHKPRLRIVKVRLMGHTDDVDAVADTISQTLTTGTPSDHYPNRRDPANVRVYLEVSPE